MTEPEIDYAAVFRALPGKVALLTPLLVYADANEEFLRLAGRTREQLVGRYMLDATVTFAQAATEAGVRSVVNMSQISARREAVSNQARQHWLAERLLDRTAMLTAPLRPTFFAEWIS
jgi:NAD(P)H dehydrogenase (quinone)